MDQTKAAFVGTGPVGATGPQLPTQGLFGTGGGFDAQQALKSTSSLATGASAGFGAFGAIESGKQAADQFNFQAGSQELSAEIVKVNALERSTALRKQLLRDLGSANASAAARGIDTGSGTPRQIVQQSIGEVETAISDIESGSDIQVSGIETSASRTRAGAAAREYGGYVNAAQGLGSLMLGRI